MEVKPEGPVPARILICGEAPGADEVAQGRPFVGYSGKELDKMLGEAGISRGECFVTNVTRERPPGNDITKFFSKSKKERESGTYRYVHFRDRWVKREIVEGVTSLKDELERVRPNVIIALGNTALWALTGNWGILKWRGSMLYQDLIELPQPTKVIPAVHPAAVLRQWNLRATAVNDLRRAARFRDGSPYPEPARNFILRPTYAQALSTLNHLHDRLRSGEQLALSFDLETSRGHIACAGIAWSRTDAICVPFMQSASGAPHYWSLDEEADLVLQLYRVLTHPNAKVVGQNLLYDFQYTHRHWHFLPRLGLDTMVAWHSIFSDLPKNIAFICSMMNNYYRYWKEDK